MSRQLLQAFESISDGRSVDRVIADPGSNARFISECRHHGLTDQAVDLNLSLLNARKSGGMKRQSGRTRTILRNQNQYAFAAEIAVRSLERKHRTTLDRVLCDPDLASEFDRVAESIAPGFTPLEYRWAALRLRKSSKLKPEILHKAIATQVFGPVLVVGLDLSNLPDGQGVYIWLNREKVLYVGEAAQLRSRLKKHLNHSDIKFLAHYIWEFGSSDLLIEYHVLPDGTRTDVRKALERELIRSRKPEFNIQR